MKRVYINDLRRFGYCAKGSRAFLKQHGLDWSLFIRDGLPVETLEKTGDAMAIKIAEAVRNE